MEINTDTGSSESISTEPSTNKFLIFLNTPLGLWLLSSIFIGLITFSYQNWSQAAISERVKKERINSLKTEINRRIIIFNKEIELLSEFDTMDVDLKDENKYPQKIEQAIRKVNSKNCYVFEEFRKRKLSSLLYELAVLLTDEDKIIAQDAFEKMFIIEQFPRQINKHTSIGAADKYLEKILAYTKTSLSKSQWNDN